MTHANKTLFITGIHRGLGKATAIEAARRGWRVVGSVRKPEHIADVVQWNEAIRESGQAGSIEGVLLDVEHIEQMPIETRRALETCDVLVNCAGWGAEVDTQDFETGILDMDTQVLQRAIAVNFEGPRRLIAIALPHMKSQGWGRIVNVSSERAKIGSLLGDAEIPAYRISKLMLNGLTAQVARSLKGTGVLINSLCPGWCKTDMGGPLATDDVETGVDRILAMVELPDDGPNGGYFIHNRLSDF